MSREGTTPPWTVVAVGIDTTDVAEVGLALRRRAERYLRFVLSDAERAESAHAPDRDRDVARRWAAKEAVTKVLGPADDDPWPWSQVEVLGLPAGTVEVRLAGRARERAHALGIDHLEVREHGDDPERVTATAIGLTHEQHPDDITREKDR